ncbi:hypothetical protein [Aquihabitans sp. G128]|uniref:hypothetical protein n=1 Tax=Aquihabitans sp. G128 TaxID=2849779 RepID=UPI00352F2DF7
MATFVLIPGAGSGPWYWHLVEDELQRLGHDTVAVELPCDDDSAGFAEYVDAAVAALGDRTAGRDRRPLARRLHRHPARGPGAHRAARAGDGGDRPPR